MKTNKKKSFNKRAIVSITLFITFILVPISGKMIQIAAEQNGRESFTTYFWEGAHVLTAFIFTVAGVFHIVYNWSVLKRYFRKKN